MSTLEIQPLIVGGTFDDQGGKPSGYVKRFCQALNAAFSTNVFTESALTSNVWNGGSFDLLELRMETIKNYNLIIWMADIPNDKPKLLTEVKKRNPKCLLVSSKSNFDREQIYEPIDLIGRALFSKSNLMIEFTKVEGRFAGTVWDPLGNVYAYEELDIDKLALALAKRLKTLMTFTRIGSVSIGEAEVIPVDDYFFELIRKYGDRFHELIHGAHPSRFLGNASFRCTKGFPAFKDEQNGRVYVSRRDVDKRGINEESFISVMPSISSGRVEYFGERKPSVDTPLQVKLFDMFPQIRYMLHSHCYIGKAPMTKSVIPCGALEEVDEIVEVVSHFAKSSSWECGEVNLRGHGSLVMADDLVFLENIHYIGRPFPERQDF